MKRMVRIAVSVAIGVACWTGGSRDAAEAAIADAEDTITDVHARAIRYAPEEFKAVMDEYSAAREALEGEDFRGAVRSAHRAIELAKEVSRTATVQRNALEADWPTLRDSVTRRYPPVSPASNWPPREPRWGRSGAASSRLLRPLTVEICMTPFTRPPSSSREPTR